jgi:hypothetical protein
MSDDRRQTAQEATLSGAVPPVVKPFAVVRKRFPATLSGVVDKLRRHKRRMAKRFSKKVSPPNPPIV